MIRLTCLAMFVLLPLGCGGNGEGETDQQPSSTDQSSNTDQAANTDQNSTPTDPPKMTTYLLDFNEMQMTIEAPSGLEASTRMLTGGYAGDRVSISFAYMSLSTSSPEQLLETQKWKTSSTYKDRSFKLLDETEDSFIASYSNSSGKVTHKSFFVFLLGDKKIAVSGTMSNRSTAEEAIQWAKTLKAK